MSQAVCPRCGRAMRPLTGKALLHTDGYYYDYCLCDGCGNTQYHPRTVKGGPCPKCGHEWETPVRGNQQDILAGEGF